MKFNNLLILVAIATLLFAFSGVADLGGSHNVTLVNPTNNSWNSSGIADFRFNVSGNLSGTNYSCTLYHDISQSFAADSVQVNATVDNETTTTFRKAGIAENSTGWNWNVVCTTNQNSTGVRAKTNWTYKVDTTSPASAVYSPTAGAWDADGNVTLGINITEANPNNCILQTNLNASQDSNSSGTYNTSAVTQAYADQTFLYFDFGSNSSDSNIWLDNNTGTYQWTVNCDDDAGNTYNPSNITFYVDSVAPTSTGNFNVTAPTNNSKSTDYTPNINWYNMTTSPSENFSRYEILVDNDSDYSSPEYQENITTVSTNYTTASGLSGDVDYYVNVTAFDLAGNKLASANQHIYRTDSTCAVLTTGWNICSVIRSTTVNASDLCTEVGSNCVYISKYNSTHGFETYTTGGSTNAGINFSASVESPDEDAVYWIYVNAETNFENRTWSLSANDFLFNLTNYSSGWNLVPVLNQTGFTLGQLDQSINGDGSAVTVTNHSQWFTFYNNSAASGSKYVDYVRNWTINNNSFVDYGEAVWVHINKTILTSEGSAFYWNSSGEF